jgi:hypothetical protein
MEITMRWHRLLRALAFVAGGLVFSVLIIFIFSNLAPINVHWRIPATVGYSYDLTLPEVNTWLIALVPLLLGLVAGYLYQTPARMHHVREALRHRHRVHELEHELKEMRTSLDRLLMMPEDGRPAIPAQIMAPVERREAESEDERDPRLPDEPAAVEVLAAKPVKEEVKKAAVRKAPAAVKAARPRRRFFGLQAEVAEIKLPDAIPATIVARPRRENRATNGRSKPALTSAAKPAATPGAKPVRKRAAKKPS